MSSVAQTKVLAKGSNLQQQAGADASKWPTACLLVGREYLITVLLMMYITASKLLVSSERRGTTQRNTFSV